MSLMIWLQKSVISVLLALSLALLLTLMKRATSLREARWRDLHGRMEGASD